MRERERERERERDLAVKIHKNVTMFKVCPNMMSQTCPDREIMSQICPNIVSQICPNGEIPGSQDP